MVGEADQRLDSQGEDRLITGAVEIRFLLLAHKLTVADILVGGGGGDGGGDWVS